MKQFLIIIAFSSIHLVHYATQCYSIGNGDWSDPTSWSCGQVPSCGDTIVISIGTKITIDSQIDISECPEHTQLTVEGELAFTNGNKLSMNCNSDLSIAPSGVIYKDGNGGGNSTLIEQCGTNTWTAGDGDFNGPYNWGGSLPIELLYFNAEAKEDYVELKWKTASETNNDFFTIEKSKDGYNFEPLKQVAGAQNSSSEINYQEKDLNPYNGVSYYRLKQTDNNGDNTYSKIKSVTYSQPDIVVYPNPSNTHEKLVLKRQFTILGENMEDYTIQAFSMEGRKIPINYKAERHQITIQGIDEAGSYIIKLNDQKSFHNIRVIVH